jgi:hypothetical protein
MELNKLACIKIAAQQLNEAERVLCPFPCSIPPDLLSYYKIVYTTVKQLREELYNITIKGEKQ